MSLSNDLLELLELWAELNLTAGDHGNLSSVEMLRCSGAVSHATLLHFLSVLLVLIFLSGAAANVLLLWERGGREERLYVVQLAAADLSVLATLPVWVASLQRGGRWPFGERLCQLTHFIFSVNLFSSIFFLTCMSADHFLSATLAPAAGRRRRRLACAAVWLLALAASVPDTYFLRAVSVGDGAVCRPVFPPRSARFWAAALQLSFVLLGFVLPLLVIVASLLPPAGVLRSGRRAARAYVSALVVCWLPYHATLLLDTVTLLRLVTFSCRLEDFLDVALHLTQVCSLLHCVVSPALYLMLRPRSRDVISHVFFRYSAKTGLARLGHASDSQLELTAEQDRNTSPPRRCLTVLLSVGSPLSPYGSPLSRFSSESLRFSSQSPTVLLSVPTVLLSVSYGSPLSPYGSPLSRFSSQSPTPLRFSSESVLLSVPYGSPLSPYGSPLSRFSSQSPTVLLSVPTVLLGFSSQSLKVLLSVLTVLLSVPTVLLSVPYGSPLSPLRFSSQSLRFSSQSLRFSSQSLKSLRFSSESLTVLLSVPYGSPLSPYGSPLSPLRFSSESLRFSSESLRFSSESLRFSSQSLRFSSQSLRFSSQSLKSLRFSSESLTVLLSVPYGSPLSPYGSPLSPLRFSSESLRFSSESLRFSSESFTVLL
ncbi:uncharacterized protein LOC128354569 [Scomber japonicus]|uniref:uncharacterized protein LOC128354569 n=1 Tax=Scomber japonicus TaxID=13676 RepID=UPI00230671E9|nr:uncharacterized protein LOC128354569 [Scomber japonicus]